ncbi:hypothetical protein, partial [Ralstonia pseudosolanacearum]
GTSRRQKLRQTTGGNLPARPLQRSQLKPTGLLESRGDSNDVLVQNAVYGMSLPIETLPRIANATIGVDVSLFLVLLGSLASDVDRIKIIAMI